MATTYDEAALIQRATAGDGAALRVLVNEHRRNISSIAQSYCSTFRYNVIDKNDLEQEGAIGFIKAVSRFDAERGVSLWTYAEVYVRQQIIAMLRHMGKTIRVPEDAVAVAKEARRLEIEWAQLNLEFTLADIASHMGVSLEYLKIIRARLDSRYVDPPWEREDSDDDKSHNEKYLAAPIDIEGDITDQLEDRWKLKRLLSMLDDLTPREKRVIIRHYGLNGKPPATLSKIAKQWRVDPSEISRIHTSAKTKLIAMAREMKQ